jgi:hypothetical protein
MANNPFDRAIHNQRERPLSSDLNLLISQSDEMSRVFQTAMSGVNTSGFFNDGFFVKGTGGLLQYTVFSGIGFNYDPSNIASNIGGIPNVNDPTAIAPMVLSANYTATLAANPAAGLERYDLIEVKPYRHLTDPSNRDILDIGTGVFAPALVNKTLSYDMLGNTGTVLAPANSTAAISVKQGVPAPIGTAVIPTQTAGYNVIAIAHVKDTTSSLVNEITDERTMFYGFQKFGSSSYSFRITELNSFPSFPFFVLSNLNSAPQSLRYGVVPLSPIPLAIPFFNVVYLINGNPQAVAAPVVQMHSYPSGSPAQPFVSQQVAVAPTLVNLTAPEVAALQAAPNNLDVAVGQKAQKMLVRLIAADNAGGGVLSGMTTVGDAWSTDYTWHI